MGARGAQAPYPRNSIGGKDEGPGTPLEAKMKEEEERGEMGTKKREEEEGAPLGAGFGSTTAYTLSDLILSDLPIRQDGMIAQNIL